MTRIQSIAKLHLCETICFEEVCDNAKNTTYFHSNNSIIYTSQFHTTYGSIMPGRYFSSGTGYRYGFNGQIKDDEIYGSGNALSFEYRVHDARLGRFLSVDPDAIIYPYLSSYCFAGNNPIMFVDMLGRGPTLGPFSVSTLPGGERFIARIRLIDDNVLDAVVKDGAKTFCSTTLRGIPGAGPAFTIAVNNAPNGPSRSNDEDNKPPTNVQGYKRTVTIINGAGQATLNGASFLEKYITGTGFGNVTQNASATTATAINTMDIIYELNRDPVKSEFLYDLVINVAITQFPTPLIGYGATPTDHILTTPNASLGFNGPFNFAEEFENYLNNIYYAIVNMTTCFDYNCKEERDMVKTLVMNSIYCFGSEIVEDCNEDCLEENSIK